jgi:large subunit ribosomal protein L10
MPVKPRRNPVALGLEGKKAIVAEVQEAAQSALSAVVADSRGVTVSKMTALRKQARENGVWIKIVRNTLARRAVEGTAYECLVDSFVGPTLIAFSKEHPGAGARILQEFAKENDKFELKVAAFEGELVNIAMLATLPTYDEAIAKLMSVMKEAAAGKLVRTLAAVGEQKQQAA